MSNNMGFVFFFLFSAMSEQHRLAAGQPVWARVVGDMARLSGTLNAEAISATLADEGDMLGCELDRCVI